MANRNLAAERKHLEILRDDLYRVLKGKERRQEEIESEIVELNSARINNPIGMKRLATRIEKLEANIEKLSTDTGEWEMKT